MRIHSVRRILFQRRVLIAVGLVVLAGAAAAMEVLSSDTESDASATSDDSATTVVSDDAAAPAPAEPPLDLDPWEVTPANAPEPPAGQVPAWVLNPTPPDEVAIAEEPPPPPRLPPEPHETPWTETSPDNAQ